LTDITYDWEIVGSGYSG